MQIEYFITRVSTWVIDDGELTRIEKKKNTCSPCAHLPRSDARRAIRLTPSEIDDYDSRAVYRVTQRRHVV